MAETDEERRRRRVRTALEAAFWDLEIALFLGGGTPAAPAVLAARAAVERCLDAPDSSRNSSLGAPEPDCDVKERLRALDHAARNGNVREYALRYGIAGALVHRSSSGVRFLRLVTETFPRHFNYVYVVDLGDQLVLWDCGSGLGRSRQMLVDGMKLASLALDFRVAPEDLDVIFVSHGHYDHFGDAAWWKRAADAPLWIHEWDARVLERFKERTALTGRDMAIFLRGAGCTPDDVKRLVAMYLESKNVYHDVPVDRRLRHGQKLFDGRARVIHTPGHCPGHVCLRIDDALLVADQVLSPITPHVTPQVLNPHNGLERYMTGLGRLASEEGVRHVLPAHYEPIPDLGARIREIAEDHVEKLHRTLEACANGATIIDVMQRLFGSPEGYNVLLAILEAGTHVEYLHQVGSLAVQNIDDVSADPTQPLRYVTTAPHAVREIVLT